jgi:uncharacterized protein
MPQVGGILHKAQQEPVMGIIIDRRLNQGQKTLGNRQRFIQKSKKQIKASIRERLNQRSISDTQSGEKVKIPLDTIREPTFGHNANSGERQRVLPGNRNYVPQDRIKKPESGEDGGGNKASNSTDTGQDDFDFVLTRDEFYDLFFEDLELPDMIRKQLKTQKRWETRREGISTAGNPSNLNVIRTMRSSMGRRLILRKPHEKTLEELQLQLQQLDPNSEEYAALVEHIQRLTNKVRSVAYVDPIDLRYNVFNRKPMPSNSAVMFCVMDVSGSMDENKKDLAKRFFMLLYLFLQRKYDNVIVEFVRHHTTASRVDEQTFFYEKTTGGTVVSSALDMVCEIIQQDYSPELYNIYVCQASDGDNWDDDNSKCRSILENQLLPQCQYMAYVEVHDEHMRNNYPQLEFMNGKLYNTYSTVSANNARLQLGKVFSASDIYAVFSKLFEKK